MVDKESDWNSKVVKLLIPDNCFTLWNSKTIHANTGMPKKAVNTMLDRLTCYLTYLPKVLRTPEILEKRKVGYMSAQTTSHWSHKYEPKKYPFGFKKQHESKGFGVIVPTLVDNDIPTERLALM